jgi:hypothetical protein
MSDLSGPVARALIAYFDALAKLEGLAPNGPNSASRGVVTVGRMTDARVIAAHEALYALRQLLDVSLDQPILTQDYQIALQDLICEYGDPDSSI